MRFKTQALGILVLSKTTQLNEKKEIYYCLKAVSLIPASLLNIFCAERRIHMIATLEQWSPELTKDSTRWSDKPKGDELNNCNAM